MPKINLEIINTNKEKTSKKDLLGLKYNNTIKYVDRDNIVTIILDDQLTIINEDKEHKTTLKFKKNMVCKGIIELKTDHSITIEVRTIKLTIEEKYLYIKYEIIDTNETYIFECKEK